jgi:hypothetical protein
LTFDAKNLIKGTQARTSQSVAQSDVKGESIDEERNEEKGARKKEGRPEEKEVVTIRSAKSEVYTTAPSNRGRFYFVPTPELEPRAG